MAFVVGFPPLFIDAKVLGILFWIHTTGYILLLGVQTSIEAKHKNGQLRPVVALSCGACKTAMRSYILLKRPSFSEYFNIYSP